MKSILSNSSLGEYESHKITSNVSMEINKIAKRENVMCCRKTY